jgi:hypothetical protein
MSGFSDVQFIEPSLQIDPSGRTILVCYKELWYKVPDIPGGWTKRQSIWQPSGLADAGVWSAIRVQYRETWDRITTGVTVD